MTEATATWNKWVTKYRGMQKNAADEAALAMKDPNCKGTVEPPAHPDGDNRSALNLPENQRNSNSPGTLPRNLLATDPNGVGQGEYITPENGDAKDKAYTSPTTPLSKIAEMLQRGVEDLSKSATEIPAAPAHAVQPEKSASQEVNDLPADIKSDPDLMSKLASCTLVMLSTTDGQIQLERQLKKAAGIAEAHALIQQVQAEVAEEQEKAVAYHMQKQASAEAAAIAAASQPQFTPEQMQKIASAEQAHTACLSQFQNDFEKVAYMQGAADAEAMDAGLQGGAEDPSIPGMEGQLSDEDIMAAISELVESGQIPAEAVEAILQELGADGEPGGSLEEIAQLIEAAVQSGELAPEQAQALVEQILANDPEAAAAMAEGGEGAPVEEPAPEAGAVDPEAVDAVTKAASALQSIFNPQA